MTRRRLHPPTTLTGSADPPARQGARIRGPLDLARAVPYLLGFHPYVSLVLIGLRAGHVLVTARMDLPDAAGSPLGDTMAAIARGGGDAVVAAVFEDLAADSPGGLPLRADLVARLRGSVLTEGLALGDVVQLGAGRWRSLCCDDDLCCPPDGSPLPGTTSQFEAAAVLDGVAPLPDRASVAARFAPLPDECRAAVAESVERARQETDQRTGHAPGREVSDRHRRVAVRGLFAAARASGERDWQPPDDQQAARFGVALALTPVRVAVWNGVDDERLDGRPLWLHLSRCLPPSHAAAALLLYAWAAWRRGDGAAAVIATERLHAVDPRGSEADLLSVWLRAGVDPRRVPPLRLPTR